MPFVIDASVTMAWCFEDEATAATEHLLDRLDDEEALVPALWRFEVTNVLLVAERRGRMSEAQARHVLDLLGRLPIRIEESGGLTAGLLDLARRHGLSAYGAAYLDLAERRGTPLATLDRALARACSAAGVPTLGA